MPSPPARNAAGDLLPYDDPAIEDDHRVIRRISLHHIVADKTSRSGTRISSMAFRPSSRGTLGMSVDLEQSILGASLDPVEFVSRRPFIGAVVFLAGFLRSLSLKVGADPSPDNPHHGEVWGRFDAACQRRLRAAAVWYVTIDSVDL